MPKVKIKVKGGKAKVKMKGGSEGLPVSSAELGALLGATLASAAGHALASPPEREELADGGINVAPAAPRLLTADVDEVEAGEE